MREAGEGFFSRWSRRKQAVREGRPAQEPPAAPSLAEPPSAQPLQGTVVSQAPAAATPTTDARQADPPEPPPTLQDVAQLTPQSDFSRFVRPDVDPAVRNAALRKLFADPHFNVMDGLDVYIDDYNTPNPLPASMLRKMASARFLGLVQDEARVSGPAAAALPAEQAPAPVAQAQPPQPAPAEAGLQVQPAAQPEEKADHEDPDLRLQQDHAAGCPAAGRGAR